MPAAVAKAVQYAQVDQLLAERNSQRRIVRLTGVSRMMVAKRAKKSAGAIPALAPTTAQKSPEKTVGGP